MYFIPTKKPPILTQDKIISSNPTGFVLPYSIFFTVRSQKLLCKGYLSEIFDILIELRQKKQQQQPRVNMLMTAITCSNLTCHFVLIQLLIVTQGTHWRALLNFMYRYIYILQISFIVTPCKDTFQVPQTLFPKILNHFKSQII